MHSDFGPNVLQFSVGQIVSLCSYLTPIASRFLQKCQRGKVKRVNFLANFFQQFCIILMIGTCTFGKHEAGGQRRPVRERDVTKFMSCSIISTILSNVTSYEYSMKSMSCSNINTLVLDIASYISSALLAKCRRPTSPRKLHWSLLVFIIADLD